jgi:hypothetical protein
LASPLVARHPVHGHDLGPADDEDGIVNSGQLELQMGKHSQRKNGRHPGRFPSVNAVADTNMMLPLPSNAAGQ